MLVHSVRTVALLLLGLVLAASAPRNLWHECGHAHAIDVGAQHAALSADAHCPLCEATVAPFIPAVQPVAGLPLAARSVLVMPGVHAAFGCVVQVPPGRGPPLMAA